MLHHEVHEGHEEFGNYHITNSSFVIFAIFVVKCRFRFLLRLRRAMAFAVTH